MVFVGQWHWLLLWVPGLGVICGCGHGFSWLVIWDGWGCGGFLWAQVAGSLVVRSGWGGGLGVSMSICLFVFALGDCFLGAWWAGQLPGFWGAFPALSVSGCWLGVSSAVSAAVGCLGFGCFSFSFSFI